MEITNAPVKPSERKAKSKSSYKMKLSEAATGHLIRVLIDQYSDPIAAVIREYSSNARDAHIAAGKVNVPIEIALPTENSPSLKIRDRGVGLDESGLETYVELGESTKRNSNEQTGAYGLGCKSGLTVADHFNVISVRDGIKRFCVVGGDADGELALDVFKEIDTDEENGVEVRIPFDTSRYTEIREKAMKFFSFWEKGSVLVDGVEPKNWLEDSDDANRYSTEYGEVAITNTYGSDVFVSMGNVAYPVELNKVSSVLNLGEYSGLRKMDFGFKSETSILLKADIGTLDLVPSRDSLNYTVETSETIKNLFIKLYEKVSSEINGDISTAKSFAEAERKIALSGNVLLTEKEAKMYGGRDSMVSNDVSYNTFRGHTYNVEVKGIPFDQKGFDTKSAELVAKVAGKKLDAYEMRAAKSALEREHFFVHRHGSADMNTSGVLAKVVSDDVQHLSKGIKVSHSPRAYSPDTDWFKRTVVLFDPKDYPLRELSFASWRRKLTDWMMEEDVDYVHLFAGAVDKSNPWVFDNDNVRIVDAADLDAKVKEIRKRIRAENKAAGVVRKPKEKSEPMYEFSGGNDYHYQDSALSNLDEKITTLYYAEGTSERPRGNVLKMITQIDDAMAVTIKGNRSMDIFFKTAEELGFKTVPVGDFARLQALKAKRNQNVKKFIEASKRRSELNTSYLFNELVEQYSKETKYGEVDILGINISDLYDASYGELNRASNAMSSEERALVHMLDATTTNEIQEATTSLNLPDRQKLKEEYPMLEFAYSLYSDRLKTVVDYIKLVNDSK